MQILRSLSVLAALGFVGIAHAQTATVPSGPSVPTPFVTDSPTNPELAGASTHGSGGQSAELQKAR